MIDLKSVSLEIREILEKKREELCLSFIEESHTYYMKDTDGIIKNNFPSVSSVHEHFYEPFDAQTKSFQMCDGDLEKQSKLLESWAYSGVYASNKGSYVHFELEKEAVRQYGNYKVVRSPIFDCDEKQITDGNNMIIAGKRYLDLLHERGAVLLETEAILGSMGLGYVGTPDKIWLIHNKNKDNFMYLITDWKTNKPDNFIPQGYTKMLYSPFDDYHATTLGHYYIQLPLYSRLLLNMLSDSKYKDIKVGGCIVVLLKEDATFEEFRVPGDILNGILTMDLSYYIRKK